MGKKTSRFQRWRADFQALLEQGRLPGDATFSRTQKFIHFCIMVWRSFTRNRCPVRASALAYASLLALIPMLAVVLSVTSTFLKQEGEDRIDQFIARLVASVVPEDGSTNAAQASIEAKAPSTEARSTTSPPAETSPELRASATNAPSVSDTDHESAKTRRKVARRIHEFIQNTQSGALGITGSVLLIFAAISMLSRIETTFNDIWGVERGRTWFMRIVLYWGVITLAPLLLVLALGLATGSHLEAVSQWLATLPFVGKFLFRIGMEVLPVLVLCLTFGAFYMLMPNTKVEWSAALVGGLVAGLLLHLNNLVSVLYVSRVVSNSKIYGSLGLVPVFMIGLYCAWLILLFGGQMAYAYQNLGSYLEARRIENVNQRGREFIALRLLTLVGQRYLAAEPPPTVQELSEGLSIPSRLVQQVLQTLSAARLLTASAGAEPGYLPARPMENITCHDLLEAMRASQGHELATRDEPARAEVYGEFERILTAERQAASSVTMHALASRALVQVEGAALKPLAPPSSQTSS